MYRDRVSSILSVICALVSVVVVVREETGVAPQTG